ncbi:trk system potassium uptake protein TrkH [Tistlia consotensis]|uniref:Trk system potassium uptake protein n=1 Tax=Tistlia consotensis USBA 355 TaxID=560819 RepID=A0A1Y6BL26_9PROT|nr:TrkH family potassium uptake protein [Tistlia consotensis]SMF09009.1 trk system potassium uptake protein TrkH [Tistlia consotensis USBA 355]SNR34920.1 trk system potassium uptake protein TrkH [Tistlia consotensis]
MLRCPPADPPRLAPGDACPDHPAGTALNAILDSRPVFFILGLVLLMVSAAMLVPAFVEWGYGHPDSAAYFISSVPSLFLGGALVLANRSSGKIALHRRDVYILTALTWIVVPAFAGAPFMITNLGLSPADAYFESVSGLTTTGSTVIADLAQVRPGLLMWRSLLQWLGGIGIVVMAIAILPFLRVGGMQLMRAESSDRSDKILPRPGQTAAAIGGIYLGLSLLCVFGYLASGMTVFEAINHAMTTLSTGGYSTSNTSLGAFSPAAQWVAIVFMLSGALPFAAYVRAVRGVRGALVSNPEIRLLAGVMVVASLLFVLPIWLHGTDRPVEALRHAAFTVATLVTTTGYASTDYQQWGGSAVILAFLLTMVGGCTGSTAGGIKMLRWRVLAVHAHSIVRHTVQPHRVIPRSYHGKPLPDDVVAGVMGFFVLYVAVVTLIALALGFCGLDFITALSSSAQAVSNVGPGLGAIVGPSGNFASLPDAAKWLLSLGMILGRLELLTLLVLCDPAFWRA